MLKLDPRLGFDTSGQSKAVALQECIRTIKVKVAEAKLSAGQEVTKLLTLVAPDRASGLKVAPYKAPSYVES